MKLLNQTPLNNLVDQAPLCGAPLAAWRLVVDEARWQSFGEMRKELLVVQGTSSNEFVFMLVQEICHVEAVVVFDRQIILVTDARLVQAISRRAA